MATLLASQSKYFSVEADIDFASKKYYALGTSSNKFNGHINGNMHTISNINIAGGENTGLFGYNNGGVIEGFIKNPNSFVVDIVKDAISDSYKRLIEKPLLTVNTRTNIPFINDVIMNVNIKILVAK